MRSSASLVPTTSYSPVLIYNLRFDTCRSLQDCVRICTLRGSTRDLTCLRIDCPKQSLCRCLCCMPSSSDCSLCLQPMSGTRHISSMASLILEPLLSKGHQKE